MFKQITLIFALGASMISGQLMAGAVSEKAVLTTYADIAHAAYEDSLILAKKLKGSIDQLIAQPTETNLRAARAAWVNARVPYQQTEAYRFGNAIVDDWEGKVNAWPLDEGLIDYVDSSSYGKESDENPLYTANVIASRKLQVGDKVIDTSKITKELLQNTLQEADEIEANVATGYHAIEFLLWGQDLNGTKAGAGNRKASDFDPRNCTNGNCDRRGQYLKVVTDLLIDDLAWMTAQWAENGAARKSLLKGDPKAGLGAMVTGMGSLSYGELAGERMRLGLMLHDPEEEHDCFSDNTHFSHYYDAKSVQNVYLGSYTRIDGTRVSGASLSDLVAEKNPALDQEIKRKLNITMSKMDVLVSSAAGGEAYDQLIAEGNSAGNAKVMAAINALVDQTRSLETAASALGLQAIQFEGSDSLDAPEKVGA
ncbi:MAG TPA: peptidase [Chromatiaceae bacterium]|nr:peptidase [Chromatiaceae bacterium]